MSAVAVVGLALVALALIVALGAILAGWRRRLLALHATSDESGGHCVEDGARYPCPTLLAIGVRH